MQVFFALTMAAIAISQSSSLSPDSSKADVAASSIFEIIDRESKIDPSVETGRVLDNVKGDIELRHVSFTYPARPDVQIFQDLCLSIRAGKVRNFKFAFFDTKKNKSFNLSKKNLCFDLHFSDSCFGRRKRERKINCDRFVTKVLRSRFR